MGQDSFNSPAVGNKLDAQFNLNQYANALLKSLQKYLESIGVPETGGDEWLVREWATYGGISTTDAFTYVLAKDAYITGLSRELGIRKALIQAPIMWELRKWNVLDFVANQAVLKGASDDSSTGWVRLCR